jgi:hypothetical protein
LTIFLIINFLMFLDKIFNKIDKIIFDVLFVCFDD